MEHIPCSSLRKCGTSAPHSVGTGRADVPHFVLLFCCPTPIPTPTPAVNSKTLPSLTLWTFLSLDIFYKWIINSMAASLQLLFLRALLVWSRQAGVGTDSLSCLGSKSVRSVCQDGWLTCYWKTQCYECHLCVFLETHPLLWGRWILGFSDKFLLTFSEVTKLRAVETFYSPGGRVTSTIHQILIDA